MEKIVKVRPERIKHIIAAAFLLLFAVFFLVATIVASNENPEFKMGVGPIAFEIGAVIVAVFVIVDMFWFCVTVEGNTVQVKHNNITDSFDFNINEIKKIEFRSKRYKSFVTYYTTITTSEKVLEINNAQVGYKSMLIYLKDKYDNGYIAKSAISQFDYSHLVDNIEYYAKV